VNGLEVADANININIRSGQVLSYGNSVSCSRGLDCRSSDANIGCDAVLRWLDRTLLTLGPELAPGRVLLPGYDQPQRPRMRCYSPPSPDERLRLSTRLQQLPRRSTGCSVLLLAGRTPRPDVT
jgi:hypothetical protein